VASNSVTVCGSKFPTTIGKHHHQHRHNAISKPLQAIRNTKNPSFCDNQGAALLLPKSNILTAFVHSHSRLFSDVSPGLQTYSNYNITQFEEY
jgi:hypothetical protein